MYHCSRLAGPLVRIRNVTPALFFTAGVCAGQGAAWFISLPLLIGLAIALGFVIALTRIGGRGGLVGCVVGLVTAGWGLATHPPPLAGADVQLLLQIDEVPRRRVPGELVFVGRDLLGDRGALIRCRAVDLPWRALSSVSRGDIVWVRGPLQGVSRPFNPFSWDGWLWRRGISGEMKVLFASKPLYRSSKFFDRIRERTIAAVSSVTHEERGGSLFLSMALGVRDVLSPPVEALFMTLGLSHLLVVSGYQVSLVFAVVFSILSGFGGALRASIGARNGSIAASLIFSAAYVFAIGAEMSSVRALLAAVCVCVSLILNRRHGFAQRLLVTLLCMHIVWPWAIFELGVVLTFAALVGIGIGSVLGSGSRWRSLVWVTISVWSLTSLVTVIWNGSLSWSGLLLNLALATPWSIINCTVGVAGLGLTLLGIPGGALVLKFVGGANEMIVTSLFWIHGVVGSSTEMSSLSRLLVAGALCAVSGLIVGVAARRQYGVRLREMTRGIHAHLDR